MKGHLQSIRNFLIVLILTWGLLALLVRLSTPFLEHAREPLARWLSEQADMPVQIGRLEASWWGLGPRLDLYGVRLGEGDSGIRLDEVELDLNHTSLLRGQLFDALRLTIKGLQLKLVLEANGQLHIEGFPVREGGQPAMALPRYLRLRNAHLTWEDRRHGAPPITIDPVSLDVARNGQRLHLNGRLESPFGQLYFAADLHGYPVGRHWRGTSYLKGEALALPPLLGPYLPAPYHLLGGELDLELWQVWENAHEVAARGHVEAHRLRLGNREQPDRTFALHHLAGDIDFAEAADGEWRILTDALALQTTPDEPVHTTALAIRHRPGPQATLDIAATRLPVALLAQALQLRPTEPALDEALTALAPRGELHGLRLRIAPGQTDSWVLDTRLRGIAANAWRGFPGFQGLDGHLTAAPDRARLALDSKALQVDYRQLFRAPHRLQQLSGVLHWQRETTGWRLFTDELRLATPELRSVLWLDLLQRPEQPPWLALRARFEDGPLEAAGRYLPTAIMGDTLVDWLEHALQGGRMERADLLLVGPLADFPFAKHANGVFEVDTRLTGVTLDYRGGWPALHQVAARLFFQQNSLDITLSEGQVYDSRLLDTHVRLTSLYPLSPLEVQGRIEGPLADELRLLREPALRKQFGEVAKQIHATGPASLDLNLRLPLGAKKAALKMDGRLHLYGNRLHLPQWQVTLERLEGEIAFDLHGLRARKLRGRIFGAPLRLDIQPVAKGTRIRARAHWDAALLQRRFPSLPLDPVSGASDFTLELQLPAQRQGKHPVLLSLRSNLEGMRLDLPAPLGKQAAQARPLSITLALGQPPGPLHLRYGKALDARFSLDGRRGELRYARGQARLPRKNGFRVLARVETLDIGAWRDLLARLARGGQQPPPWSIELEAGRLLLGELVIDKARLHALHEGGGVIDGRLAASQITGDLHYAPGAPGLLQLDLEQLHLRFDPETASAPPTDPASGPDPRTLPRIVFNCADLRINQADLGVAHLTLQPATDGTDISTLDFKGAAGTLNAQGHWVWRQGRAHTYLGGRFQSQDLGAFLAGLGYPRQMLDARADIRFDLDWPGHPAQIHRATLHGQGKIDIRDGRLADVDPGIARVLGLLSLDALGRRLRLDFGDVLKKGYTFDSIVGSFELGDGQAITRDLVVDGPSGHIEIGGRIGLVARDFDQVVQVTPKLDTTLAIAGSLAGGPVAGLAALIAQRLLSDEIDQINRFEYSVTGCWDEPKLTPLESGGPISRLINSLGGKDTQRKTEAQEKAIDEEKTRPQRNILQKLLGTGKTPSAKQAPPKEAPPMDEGTFPQ